jgi:hypothetical protein
VEPARPQAQAAQGQGMAAQVSQQQLVETKKAEINKMYKRLDGKPLKAKQVENLVKEYEEARKRELEFDPR